MRVRQLAGVALLAALGLGAANRPPALVDAVKRGDTAAVRVLLRQQADVNAAEVDGTTALHWAARQDDVEAVKLLLRAGADVRAANRYGVTPLSLACINGSAEIVEALLKAGADPNTALPEGETAVMTAARTGDVDVLRLLLTYGADVHPKESWRGQTALMWAAAENNAAAAKLIVEAGADVAARSSAGFTALSYAVRAGHIEPVRVLLAAGASANETLPNGMSVLVLAVVNANYELAALLLEQEADTNADAQGWTALHQVVLTRRPNIGHNNPEPLPAGNLDSLEFARRLLARGANPNARVTKEPRTGLNSLNRIDATPFFLAAKSHDLEMMRLLLQSGADPHLTNVDGTTALMVAAGVGMQAPGEDPGTNEEALEAVTLMLELGDTVTTIDANGDTALHGAAFKGANAIVELLVDKGARLDLSNKKGWTPWRIAAGVQYGATFKSQPETAALLRHLMDQAETATPRKP